MVKRTILPYSYVMIRRPRGGEVVVLPQDISEMNRYAGDHKGPPFRSPPLSPLRMLMGLVFG